EDGIRDYKVTGVQTCALPISLGPMVSFVQHTGRSVSPDRQAGPHAHQVLVDPRNQFAYVADLGLDKVMIYRFDAAAHTVTPAARSEERRVGKGCRCRWARGE